MPRKVGHGNDLSYRVVHKLILQNITPAVKILVRDNQRRSRARHKELLEDLQRRLRDYEQHGIQANLDMQRAARAVATENWHLRSLLARHGVTSDEIEQYLRANGVDRDSQQRKARDAGVSLRLSSRYSTSCTSPTGENWQHPSKPATAQHSPVLPRSPPDEASASVFPTAIHFTPNFDDRGGGHNISPEGKEKSDISDHGEHVPYLFREGNDSAPMTTNAEPVPFPTEAVDSTSSSRTPASSMEMSCDDAASIITDVQGHGDRGLAFTALGCSPSTDCSVMNVRLLDLIDKSI